MLAFPSNNFWSIGCLVYVFFLKQDIMQRIAVHNKLVCASLISKCVSRRTASVRFLSLQMGELSVTTPQVWLYCSKCRRLDLIKQFYGLCYPSRKSPPLSPCSTRGSVTNVSAQPSVLLILSTNASINTRMDVIAWLRRLTAYRDYSLRDHYNKQ